MIWLVLLALIIILLLIPVGICGRFDEDGFAAVVLIGPFHGALFPRKKKGNKPAKKQKPVSKRQSPPKEKSKGGSVEDFQPIIKEILAFLNDFRCKLRVRMLQLHLVMAGDDPCDLAQNYAKANAAFGALWPQLNRCFVIKQHDIRIYCDFEAEKTTVSASLELTITISRVLWLLTFYGLRILSQYLKLMKKRKGGATT